MVRSSLVPVALEIVNQLLRARIVVVDDLAELAAVLGIHFVEELAHQDGVLVIAGEYDALAGELSGRIPESVFHQVPKNYTVCVPVVNALIDLFRREIELGRILALLFKRLDLVLGQSFKAYAFAQEVGRMLENLEGRQVTIFDCLLQAVVSPSATGLRSRTAGMCSW